MRVPVELEASLETELDPDPDQTGPPDISAATRAEGGDAEAEDLAKEERAHAAHQREFFSTCEQLMLRAEVSSQQSVVSGQWSVVSGKW